MGLKSLIGDGEVELNNAIGVAAAEFLAICSEGASISPPVEKWLRRKLHESPRN
jgi:hypothetical protein